MTKTIRCDVCGAVEDGNRVTKEYTSFIETAQMQAMMGYETDPQAYKGWMQVFDDDLCPQCLEIYRKDSNPAKEQAKAEKDAQAEALDRQLNNRLHAILDRMKSEISSPDILKLGRKH